MASTVARRCIAAGFMCAFAGAPFDARADDLTKEQCVEANESAQALRRDGKLRAARTQLLICLAKSCPGPVREDCAERMTELERSAPTIVFTAKGPAGAPLHAVQVAMDGARLTDHLDGSSLVVDPGEHTFALAADGYTSVTKKLAIREGVKGRKEVVMFTTAIPIPDAEPVPATAPLIVAKPEAPRSASSGSDQRTVAYVFGGAGIVGLGLGTALLVAANSTHAEVLRNANCPGPACKPQDLSSANSQLLASGIAFALGGALLATGVVAFLTAPRDGAVSVQPSVGPSSAGIQMGGSWQ